MFVVALTLTNSSLSGDVAAGGPAGVSQERVAQGGAAGQEEEEEEDGGGGLGGLDLNRADGGGDEGKAFFLSYMLLMIKILCQESPGLRTARY